MALPMTALVVEPNYLVAADVSGPLIASGFRVIVAVTDDEAHAALTDHTFQIAVVDFQSHHVRANSLLTRLTAAGTPYIFCTASSTEEVNETFPGCRVVEKPFGGDMLLSVITDVLNKAPLAGLVA